MGDPPPEAKSSILVKFGWENYYPDPSLGKRQCPAVNQIEMLGVEISILESRDLKEKAVSALTPEAIFPRLSTREATGLSKQDEALPLLVKYLKVEPAKGGNIIDVTFDGTNPQSAAAVANQLVDDYIHKRSEIYKDPKSALLLQNKVDYYRQKLAGLVDGQTPVRHPAKRRRIKTVMQELMYMAARLVKTGRRLKLVFSRHCPAFEAFRTVHTRLSSA